MKLNIAPPLGIGLLARLAVAVMLITPSCVVVHTEDLELAWRVDGSDSPSHCSEFGIDTWLIDVVGPETASIDSPCGDPWDSGTILHNLEGGLYAVTIRAVDADGTAIGRSELDVDLRGASGVVNVTIELLSSVQVFWRINGTIDGTATGESWDTCLEVGAKTAVVTVDGVPNEYPCDNKTMSAVISSFSLLPKDVMVKLQDESGTDLTTEATATIPSDSNTDITVDFMVDFMYDSFFKPLQTEQLGDFWFNVAYDGKSCDQTNPAVTSQIAFLDLDGTLVEDADVCNDQGQSCIAANGDPTEMCRDGDQTIPDQVWGMYLLRLQGAVRPSDNLTVCWDNGEQDPPGAEILIGAGVENPVVDFDLPQTDTQGECAPL